MAMPVRTCLYRSLAQLATFQELSSHSQKSKIFLPLVCKEEKLQVIIAYDGVAVLLRI